MAEGRSREYDASDLRELMDNTGGWARNWNDVLRYLEGPAVKDADFSKKEVPQLSEDVKQLREKDIGFTTDYRKVWRELTGEKMEDLPPPEGIRKPAVNPSRTSSGMPRRSVFPPACSGVLERIEAKQYEGMADVKEAVGDMTWDHD